MQHIYTPFQRSLWDCHSLFQKNHDAWKVTNSLDCLRNTRIIINLDDKWLWAYQFSFLPQALPKSWVNFTDHVENPCSGSQSGLCVRLSPDFKIYRYKYIHVPGSIQEPLNQSLLRWSLASTYVFFLMTYKLFWCKQEFKQLPALFTSFTSSVPMIFTIALFQSPTSRATGLPLSFLS